MSTRKLGDDDQILAYIRDHVTAYGYPPSVRGIAERWGVAPSSAQKTLERLARDGLITRAPGIPRGMSISPAGMKLLGAHDPAQHG